MKTTEECIEFFKKEKVYGRLNNLYFKHHRKFLKNREFSAISIRVITAYNYHQEEFDFWENFHQRFARWFTY